ncbi:MAG: hypothetical protein FD130_1625 [Halothiobacillaceae bacterium]|nr:MAG: hypothetical protein FD130_1625 [Halothiobacillaceae bacterium]
MLLHDFPLTSGLKVLVGIAAMAFFTSADLALEREKLVAKKVEQEGLILEASRDIFPLTSKLALSAGATLLVIGSVFALLARHPGRNNQYHSLVYTESQYIFDA